LLWNHRTRPSCATIGSNIHLISHNSHSPVIHTIWPIGHVTRVCGTLNEQVSFVTLVGYSISISSRFLV
jgi:hypothetical protein